MGRSQVQYNIRNYITPTRGTHRNMHRLPIVQESRTCMLNQTFTSKTCEAYSAKTSGLNEAQKRTWYDGRIVLKKLYLSRIPLEEWCEDGIDGYLVSVARHTDTRLETDVDVGPCDAVNDMDED